MSVAGALLPADRLERLKQLLRCPDTPEKENEIIQILASSPRLMDALIERRQQQQRPLQRRLQRQQLRLPNQKHHHQQDSSNNQDRDAMGD